MTRTRIEGENIFNFVKRGTKSATVGIKCPFLFPFYWPSSTRDQILLTLRSIGRRSSVFSSNVQAMMARLSYIMTIFIMYEHNPKRYRVARQTKFCLCEGYKTHIMYVIFSRVGEVKGEVGYIEDDKNDVSYIYLLVTRAFSQFTRSHIIPKYVSFAVLIFILYYIIIVYIWLVRYSGKRISESRQSLYMFHRHLSGAGCGWSISFLLLYCNYSFQSFLIFILFLDRRKMNSGAGDDGLTTLKNDSSYPHYLPLDTRVEFRAIMTHAKTSTFADSRTRSRRTACVNNDLARWNAISPAKAPPPPKNTSPQLECTAWCI